MATLAASAPLAGMNPGDGTSVPAAPPFQILRYNEDYGYLAEVSRSQKDWWETIKYMPLGDPPGIIELSLGGEARYQYVERWDYLFGRVPGWQGSLQQRYLVHLDAAVGPRFRVFGQLISAWEKGERPGPLPVDVDHLDWQQLFAEAKLGNAKPGDNYLRVGRQEILLGNHQLLKVREGPNVRLAFDAARLHLSTGAFALDAFTGTVVEPTQGTFQDRWVDGRMVFSGVNLGWQTPKPGFHADAFWFDYRNAFARYQNLSGREDRQTLGVRMDGRRGPWVFDYEASAQYGTLGSAQIQAWGTALFTTRKWEEVAAKPEFTLGFSYVTGDRNRPGRLDTFNCLFARGDYFGDTDLLTGSNTTDLSGRLDLTPAKGLHTTTQWDLLWRSETADGLYAPPLVFIVNGSGNRARFIGNQFTETIGWTVNRFLSVQLIGAVLVAGEFLKDATPGRNSTGLTFRTQYKF
jgi:hypothetical protein